MLHAVNHDLTQLGFCTQAFAEFDAANPIDFYCTAYLPKNAYAQLLAQHPDAAETLKKHTVPAGDAFLVRYYDQDTPLFSGMLLSFLRSQELCWKPKNPIAFDDYCRAMETVWQNYAQNLPKDTDFILFDGSLLHHPLNDMLRNYRITPEQGLLQIKKLLLALGNTKRQIFYLKPQDLPAQLRAAHHNRSQSEPTDAQIAFWQTRAQYDAFILSQLDEAKQVFDIPGNYTQMRQQILFQLTLEGGKKHESGQTDRM